MMLVVIFLAILLPIQGQQRQVFFTPPLVNNQDVDNNRNSEIRPILERPQPTDSFQGSYEPTNIGSSTPDHFNGFNSKGYVTPHSNHYSIKSYYNNQETPSFSGFGKAMPTTLDRKSTSSGRFQFNVPNIKDNFSERLTAVLRSYDKSKPTDNSFVKFGRKPTSVFLREIFTNNSKLKSSNRVPKSTDGFTTPSDHSWASLTHLGVTVNSHNQKQQRKPTLVNSNRKPLVYFDDDEPLSKAFETPPVEDSYQKIRTPSFSTARKESQFNQYDHLKDTFFKEGKTFSPSFRNPRFPSTTFRNNQYRSQEDSRHNKGRGSFSAQVTKALTPDFRDILVSTRRKTSSLQEHVGPKDSPTPENPRDAVTYQLNQSHGEHNGETGSKSAYRVVYLPYEAVQKLLRDAGYKGSIEPGRSLK